MYIPLKLQHVHDYAWINLNDYTYDDENMKLTMSMSVNYSKNINQKHPSILNQRPTLHAPENAPENRLMLWVLPWGATTSHYQSLCLI